MGGRENFIFLPSLPHRYKTRRPPLGTFETNYKMATSDGERLISTITKKGKIGDCEQSKFALGQNKNASFGNTKSFNSSSLFYIPWWEY